MKQIKIWDNISKDYYSEVVSPLKHSEKNIVLATIKQLKDKKNKSIIDLGCGTGQLLPLLVESFKKVEALDFSEGMLTAARDKISDNLNSNKVKFTQSSLEEMNTSAKSDCALLINSLVSPNPSIVEKSIQNISLLLNKDGDLIAVFPSLESIRQEYLYLYKEERKKFGDKKSREIVNDKMEIERVDFALGLYDTTDMVQKYYTQFEIVQLFEKYNLKVIKHDRIVYDQQHSFNLVDSDDNKPTDYPKMWDWFFHFKKNS